MVEYHMEALLTFPKHLNDRDSFSDPHIACCVRTFMDQMFMQIDIQEICVSWTMNFDYK